MAVNITKEEPRFFRLAAVDGLPVDFVTMKRLMIMKLFGRSFPFKIPGK